MISIVLSLVIGLLLPAAEATSRVSGMAIAGDPPTIYRLVDAEPDRSALVAYGRETPGEAVARWELDIEGRAVAVTHDGRRACVVGLKPSSGRRRGDDSTRPWILAVVDLITGGTAGPMPLNLVPSAVTLLEQPGSEPRLLIASEGRVQAYTLDPPRTSWHYESPGPNALIAAGGAGVVATLRGESLAIIDPARRPRIEGRLQLTDDDATSTVELGTPGLAVAMSGDATVAAVLHPDRLTVSLIDVGVGVVMGVRTLAAPVEAPVMEIMSRSGAGYSLHVASAGPVPSLSSVLEFDAPEKPVAQVVPAPVPIQEPPARPAAEPPPIPPVPEPAAPEADPNDADDKAPEPPSEPAAPEADPNQTDDKAPEPPPEPAAPEADPNQAGEPAPEPAPPEADPNDAGDKEPESEPEPVPPEQDPNKPAEPSPPPPSSPEPQPVRPSDEAFLTGTLTGETAAANEVRIYGPNNILKLHARTTVGPDGRFRFALPPAGSYRVVVTPDPGAHLFTHPEFRFVVVGSDGKGISGIDFEVRGKL